MKIKTKFKTGQMIFFMHGNKVSEGEVRLVSVFVKLNTKTSIRYEITGFGDLYEDDVFKTKEELLQSL